MAWFDPDWKYRKKITFDHTKVDGDLDDFPVVIHLSSDPDLSDHAQSSGNDLVFTESDETTQIDHEIEFYDGGTGELWAHVKVPFLSSSSDTEIYLYYGNPSASNRENAGDVWSNGFDAVYHLKESASGTGNLGIYKDSTNNSYDADDYVSATGSTGKIHEGQKFDGSDDYILSGYGEGVEGNQTISGWVRTNKSGHIINPYSGSQYNLRLQYDNGDTLRAVRYDGNNVQGDVQVQIDLSTVTFVVGIYDADNDEVRLYSDGSLIGTDSNSLDITTQNDYYIGSQEGSTAFLDGIIDEIRLSGVARSDEWIKTSYETQTDPSSFHTVGSEEIDNIADAPTLEQTTVKHRGRIRTKVSQGGRISTVVNQRGRKKNEVKNR
jgi:MSHA biogenesis protein MshQ